MSCSSVKPMAPCIWMLEATTASAASEALALVADAKAKASSSQRGLRAIS